MPKRFLMLLFTSLAATLLLSGVARPTLADTNVVLVSCLVDTVDTRAFRAIKIVGTSSSANAPEIPTGGQTNCAQALAILLGAGFELLSVDGGSHGALYTLYRKN